MMPVYAEADAETRGAADAAPTRRMGQAAAMVVALQAGHLFPWVPVCLAAGIGLYFGLRFEPSVGTYVAAVTVALLAGLAARRSPDLAAPAFWAVALIASGFLIAGNRAHSVAEPVLGFRYYGPIEGRIVAMDRSASDRLRLTLDQVRLDDVAPHRIPARVRVSLHGQQGFVVPEPGLRVMLTGHLSPPGGAVEPGGFDFARMAWFKRLGAVGYTRTPVLAAAPAEEGHAGLTLFRLRMALSAGIQARAPGDAGAFMAAILTGDRSGIPQDALQHLRDTNLAHLLAISGLHMGLLTGVVFGALRLLLAAIPHTAHRWPGKKIAALGALAAGAFYLALSGGNVATVRAFIMVAVMLTAVLLDRRAISLRSVAIAATLVLLLTPEALSGPGFQMSFAATTALVATYAALRDKPRWDVVPRWLLPLTGVIFASAISGAATAPFGAAHFNRMSDFGLLANTLAVPIMGSVVMPSAVASAVLWPFGLEQIGLTAMRYGTEWILAVAAWVAGLDGAVSRVPAPGPVVLPLLSFGALFVLLWRGRTRFLGLAPVLASFIFWVGQERPLALISENGRLVGVMTDQGRALSRARGNGFAADVWLENDGDGVDQAAAAERPMPRDGTAILAGSIRLHIVALKADPAPTHCERNDVVIITRADRPKPTGPCTVLDTEALRSTGSLAVLSGTTGTVLVTAADRTGSRLWSSR